MRQHATWGPAAGFLFVWPACRVQEKEVGAIATQEPRINEAINAREVRLISYDGEQMGICPLSEAQRVADLNDMDLVEIAPNATPPVCRIMDLSLIHI